MTIKELCKKQINCDVCPYLPICGDIPEKYNLGEDLEATNAIIETAKAMEQHCEDAISRAEAVRVASGYCHPSNIAKELAKLPSVQPKYNTDEWCHDCSEYDQDKHCCPRFNRVIRNTVDEMKQPKTGHWIFDEILDKHYYCSECKSMGVDYWDYCPYCGARMVEPQESE